VSLREPTKLDQLGLGRLQGEAELPQSMVQGLLKAKGVRAVLDVNSRAIVTP
jgi:hypothetical protein